ncbi:MAG: hypothetical protein AAF471_09360 [Myxococcota bacterium]
MLMEVCRRHDYITDTRESHLALPDGNKVDAIISNILRHTNPVAVDLTVVHPLAESYFRAAAISPKALLLQREHAKNVKHRAAVRQCRMDFLPFVFNTYGGWGGVVRDFFYALFPVLQSDGAEPSSVSWPLLAVRLAFIDDLAVSLQRLNAMMLLSRASRK